MQNTVNLLDGVDGLAAGVVAIVALLLVVAAVSRPDPSVSSSWEAGSSESPMPVGEVPSTIVLFNPAR